MYPPHPHMGPGPAVPGSFEAQSQFDLSRAQPFLDPAALNAALWQAQAAGGELAVQAAVRAASEHAQFAASTIVGFAGQTRHRLPNPEWRAIPVSPEERARRITLFRHVVPPITTTGFCTEAVNNSADFETDALLPSDNTEVDLWLNNMNDHVGSIKLDSLIEQAAKGAILPETCLYWPGLSTAVYAARHRAFNFRVWQYRYDHVNMHVRKTISILNSELQGSVEHYVSEPEKQRGLRPVPDYQTYLPHLDTLTQLMSYDVELGPFKLFKLIRLAVQGNISPHAQFNWPGLDTWMPVTEDSVFNTAVWQRKNAQYRPR